eukprot:scaffold159019_cov32-Prasinocladus_malaysianus.AAC.1
MFRKASYLASHARHDPPQLPEALERIRRLREAEVSGQKAVDKDAVEDDNNGEDVEGLRAEAVAAAEDRQSLAVRGLRSLLLYSSPEQLYRAALALYDLPLAYMVVDTAGLDPGDYLGDMQVRVGHMQKNIDKRQLSPFSLARGVTLHGPHSNCTA